MLDWSLKAGYSRWMGSIFTHSSSSVWMGMNKGWIHRMLILFVLYSSSIHGWIKAEWIGWGYYSLGYTFICPGWFRFLIGMIKGWLKDEKMGSGYYSSFIHPHSFAWGWMGKNWSPLICYILSKTGKKFFWASSPEPN